MISWFRNIIKNQKEWFSIDYPLSRIEGTKESNGNFVLTVRHSGVRTEITVDRDTAVRLSEWMGRVYPHRGTNVIPLKSNQALSICGTTSSPEGNPGPTGK
jgi:hypothetical protein